MSAPLNLTAEQLRTLSAALDALSEITRTHGVTFTPYGRQHLGIDDNTLSFSWDGQAYYIEDRNGD